MKTLLLTGWAWYIWSHNAVLFLEQAYEVIILDNLSNSFEATIGKIENISNKKVTFYKWDIKDKELLEKIFTNHSIDCVVHFAGAKAVWESCEKPFQYYENNIIWTLCLTEVMNKYDIKKIIFSSSATVYNPMETPPFTENTLTGNTTNPYGTTKFIIENLLRDLAIHKWFQVGNLRYFNPVWAHSSWLIWEDPQDIPNNLLPYIMKVAIWELSELPVYWNDYNTRDGTGIRDYIHVSDLALGHLMALQWLEWKAQWLFETFNLWTGKWTSVLEMIQYTQEIIWKDLQYSIVQRRAWDIASAYCLAKKAKDILDWEAQKTVQQAIQDSWNFIQTHNATTWK